MHFLFMHEMLTSNTNLQLKWKNDMGIERKFFEI